MNIAFLFPGQGSQYVGMGRQLCETSSTARKIFEEAGDALGVDMRGLCIDGDQEMLTLTFNAQPAILTAGYAAFQVFRERYGIGPRLMAGHSLGEYTALACAEAIPFADALRIVRERGRLMQEATENNEGAMYAIRGRKLDIALVRELCAEHTKGSESVVVSNYNSREEVVISGHAAAASALAQALEKLGYTAIELKVSAPFHSALMAPAARKFRDFLDAFAFKMPRWPIVSNVTALPYRLVDNLASDLRDQMVSPVKWEASMRYIRNQDIMLAVELGPRKILKKLMREIASDVEVYAWDEPQDQEAFDERLEALSKVLKQDFITKCIAIAICTRNQCFDEAEYQRGFVQPYQRILRLEQEMREQDREPELVEMEQALDMLQSAFRTKGTSEAEQHERFLELLDDSGTYRLFADRLLHAPV